MATNQTARIDALEKQVLTLQESVIRLGDALEKTYAAFKVQNEMVEALAIRATDAHHRLDAAGHAFKSLAMNLRKEPFAAPPAAHSTRLSRAEFDSALKSLRDEDREHGGTQNFFPLDMVRRRAATLRGEHQAPKAPKAPKAPSDAPMFDENVDPEDDHVDQFGD